MATSFNINQADLEKILQQIKIAEAHATGTKSLLQIIMETFGVSAANAVLMPVGLRTVDGSLNSLIPGQTEFGAADNLFPRLTDPNFLNDQDGDELPLGPPGSGAPTIDNTDYGISQSVADADPRIISNLLVDMTAANPAAVEAALRYAGAEGDVSAVRDAIVSAWNNIAATAAAAHAAQQAEVVALETLNTETAEQTAAAAANDAAQATLTAYNVALAANADAETSDVQAAVQAVVNVFGPVGSLVNQADRDAIDEAVLQATEARNSAQAAVDALFANLGAGHPDVVAAESVLANAQTLLTDLQGLQLALDSTTPNLDTSEFNAAASANTEAANTKSLADANAAQLTASQILAQGAADATAANLATANNDLTTATTNRDAAIAASNAADAALADALVTLGEKQTAAASALTDFNAANAAHAPFQQTIEAYNLAIAQNVDEGLGSAITGLAGDLDALIISLGNAGDALDITNAPDSDLTAINSAITTAAQVENAAQTAVDALQSGPFVEPGDLTAAQQDLANVSALKLRLETLRDALLADADGLLDQTDLDEALAIQTDTDTHVATATTAATQFAVSLATAVDNAAPTADALADAAAALALANSELNDIETLIFGEFNSATGNRIGGGLQDQAADAQAAENLAITAYDAAVVALANAAAADSAAQATLTAYTNALAEDVEVKANAALTEAGELVASLGAVGSIVDAADLAAIAEAVAAALATADAATNASNFLLANLGAVHPDVVAAQAVADAAIALSNQLTSLQTALGSASPLLDLSEFNMAQAALALATSNETQANLVDQQLNNSQDVAEDAADDAQDALAQADTELAAAQDSYDAAVTASNNADDARDAARPAFDDLAKEHGIAVEGIGSLVIPNVSPDVGLTAGFNSWMTFFGQFFDHGLDLVTKGGNGTVYIPLQADDPIIAGADGIFGTDDDLPEHLRFMALTRATQTIVDADGIPQHTNTTTSFVDQNQTYTSHASHQVFLREYAREGSQTFATGRLLDGTSASGSLNGAIGNWAEVKAQAIEMLGITLSDFDVHSVPLLVTDPYGKFIPGANGYAQVVVQVQIINDATGTLIGTHGDPFTMSGVSGGLDLANLALPSGLPALPSGQSYKTVVVSTGHAFLDDIAHHAAPKLVDHDHNPFTPRLKQVADDDRLDANGDGVADAADVTALGSTLTDANGDSVIDELDLADVNLDGVINGKDLVADDRNPLTYDDEMLNSHFITGDGRGNENIALTAVHSVFHSEHNRTVEVNKLTILQSGDLAFINEWLRVDLENVNAIPSDPAALAAYADTLSWDGERLFQAARFTTEMQYQHLVFEEFARRIAPDVDPFVFNNAPEIDASILAEFAHTVYRFGHSMLTGTVDRLENDLTTVNGEADQQTLLAAFLNPQMYLSGGATLDEVQANLVRGLSRDLGNEIDEFIVQDVRSNLLGLPLDLGALNIARGRDTGIPSLNETRQQLHDAGVSTLAPYTSWNDFTPNLKNPLSIVNFIAAYGTHASITSATTAAEMRDAAMLLVFGDGTNSDGVTIRGTTYTNADRLAFLNGTGDYAGNKGGMDLVDLWIGGLAEQKTEFTGMLGETFNYIFELQMENLQFGDRFYYLSRTQGMNLLNQLEPNTFTDLVMRNSDLSDKYATHLSGSLFLTPDFFFEMDLGIAQEDYNGDEDGIDPTPEPGTIEPTVIRDYSNGTVIFEDGADHNVGGSFRFIGGEHIVVGGTEGDDFIHTDKGDDTVWGDGGNDHIIVGEGADNVFGGDGDDIIEGGILEDFLRGERGNDVIIGESGLTLAFGGEGQDYIRFEATASEAFGGEGDDFILGSTGADFLLGNEGNDWIEGGLGFDTLAGDNSELFFNSTLIGHDVLFGHGDETDYDAESGDDIMGSGPSVFRYEGMFGFDWGIAKNDNQFGFGVDFDLGKPIFTTDPADILRDRFDLVEALSGWKDDDILIGDNRGHVAGVATPGATPTTLFLDNVLNAEGIDRITGLRDVMGTALTTFDLGTSYRDGNILLGGDGNDVIRGKGGYDVIDGDAWLNVRIKIVIADGPNAGIYSAESLTTEARYAGTTAGKVYHTNPDGSPNFDDVAFDGRFLQDLLLDRTINPGEMSIVREILHDTTPDNNNDTAQFAGNLAEYDIEGRGIFVDLNDDGDLLDEGENVAQRAYDLNGDGFISVTDRDNGVTGAVVLGVQLLSRGINTDDTDLLKNIELLNFADQSIAIAGDNVAATGTVTINDPTPFGTQATPLVGEVLTATLSGFNDAANPIPVGPSGLPVGLTFEWQTTEPGTNRGWVTVALGDSYTVREEDVGFAIRAVAVFKDGAGVTERLYSEETGETTRPFIIDENSPTGTLVGLVPDAAAAGGAATHAINGNNDAGGRFAVVQNGVDANGEPIFQIVVANGGPVLLDYEAVQTPIDNEYQIVIDSFDDEAQLVATRQFTIRLNDVLNEGIPTNITWTGTTPAGNTLPTGVIAQLSTVDPDAGATHTYQLLPGSAPGFAVSPAGVVTRTGAMAENSTYLLNIRTTDNTGLSFDETFTIRTLANGVANVFTGTSGDDIAYGLTGADNLNGGAGDDNLFGQDGADTLIGDVGDDSLFGGAGTDTLVGGTGNDLLVGGTGADGLSGSTGNDTIRYTIGDGVDTVIDGGADTDTVEILANGGAQTLDVTYNGTAITNFEGNTALNSIERFTANLGAGIDTLIYTSAASITVDLTAGTASGFASIAGIENVTGGAGSDTLIGVAGTTNALTGGGGNDTFTVHDTLDTVSEAAGGGTDLVQFSSTTAGATYTIADADVENLTLLGTADLNGTGNAAANVLIGNTGANTLNGLGGNDTIQAGAGNDTINYAIGGGIDTVDGGDDIDTLNITDGSNNNTLDVLYDGTVLTAVEGGTISNIEIVNANMGGAADTLSYAGSTAGVTVDLANGTGIGTASGFNQLISVLHVTGTAQDDTLSGNSGANTLSGGGGVDTLNGEAGGDILIGGAGADTINTGAANDNVADLIRYSDTLDFGDTVTNFDATGTAAQVDRFEFGGALNTAYDDGNNNNAVLFASGNGGAGTVTVTVGQANAHAEALYLSGANGEGVTNADLTDAALVAAAFNAEFNITAANNEDALLVINDTNGNSASIWQWIQTAGGGAEVDANELTLIGTVTANGTVTTASFDFF